MDSAITPYILPIIVVSIVVTIIISTKLANNKKKSNEYSSDDELLLDTYSGRKITIDEARKGFDINDQDLNRIKSEEEILNNYSANQLKVELANRAVLLKGFKCINYEGNLDELFYDSKVVAGADVSIGIAYKLVESCYLFFTHIFYYSQQKNNYNAVITINTENNLGQYILMPATDTDRWISGKLDENIITSIKGFNVERIKAIKDESRLINLFSSLLIEGNSIIETCNNYIFIYSNSEIDPDHVMPLIDLFKQIILNNYIKVKA